MADNTLIVGETPDDDSLLNVKFFEKEIRNNFKSNESGEDVYDVILHVQIAVPGDDKTIIVRQATENDKQRFAARYMSYKASKGEMVDGIPLSKMKLPENVITGLNQLGFVTVEQLANASDAVLQHKMGGMRFRREAIEFLKANSSEKEDSRDRKIAELEDQIHALIANQPKKRGPKPRTEAA